MEGKASFIILIAIVAFLSLSLALLGGYVFFFSGHTPSVSSISEHGENVEKLSASQRPKDEELMKIPLFEQEKTFNLKVGESGEQKFLRIKGVEIVYFNEVPGVKEPLKKIQAYTSELRELWSKYFLTVTVEEVNNIAGREKIQIELIKRMNEVLKETEKSRNDFIYNIIVEEWLFT